MKYQIDAVLVVDSGDLNDLLNDITDSANIAKILITEIDEEGAV